MTTPDASSIVHDAHTPVLVVSTSAVSSEPAKWSGRADPQALAYVMGPKAVVLTHQAVLNTILAVNEHLGIGESDRVMAASTPACPTW